MDDIFVASLMSTDPVTVTRDTPVRDAAQHLRERGIGSLVVADNHGRVEGMLILPDRST